MIGILSMWFLTICSSRAFVLFLGGFIHAFELSQTIFSFECSVYRIKAWQTLTFSFTFERKNFLVCLFSKLFSTFLGLRILGEKTFTFIAFVPLIFHTNFSAAFIIEFRDTLEFTFLTRIFYRRLSRFNLLFFILIYSSYLNLCSSSRFPV